jgi:hypothetical protein
MISTNRTLLTALALMGLVMGGCGNDEAPPAEGPDQGGMPAAAALMSAEVQDLVNQGNEAQRDGNFEEAMDHYRSAMERDPEHPVPQFGALMAAMALGDEALVDTLSQQLQQSAPELLAMLNPDGSMGGGMPANPHAGGMPGGMPGGTPQAPEGMTPMSGLPQGHPTLYEVGPADTTKPDTTGGSD